MDPRAAVLEGDVRLALGQPREAAQAYQRAMTLSPDLQIAAKQSAAMRSARMANPEAPLARWVAERPEDARARTLLAEAYQLTGRRELAIEQYERLAASPAAGFADLNNLAWLYYEQGDDRAEATARRAYDLAAGQPRGGRHLRLDPDREGQGGRRPGRLSRRRRNWRPTTRTSGTTTPRRWRVRARRSAQ